MTAPLPWTLPGRLLGIDVSSAQFPSAALMRSAKAAGAVTCDVKACDYDVNRGEPFTDPRMLQHLAFAKAEGLREGIYGFFKSTHAWQAQAERMVRCSDKAGPVATRHTIDWEDSARIVGAPQASLDGVLHWCEFVHTRTGRAPQVYLPPSVVAILQRAKVDCSGLLAYPLWEAHYRWNPADGRDFGLTEPAAIVIGGKHWEPMAWQVGGNGAPRFAPVDGWSPVDIDLDVLYFDSLADFDAHNAGDARQTDPAPPPSAHDLGTMPGDWTVASRDVALHDLFAMDSREPVTEPDSPTAKSSQSMRAVRLPDDEPPPEAA